MKKRNAFIICLILFLFSLLSPKAIWPQLVLGQYEDEAPVRTWNQLGFSNATSIGMGDTRFTFARDCSAAMTNPALLTLLPKITVTINLSYANASFFRYGPVNTGVITTDQRPSLSIYAWDFIGFSIKYKNIALSLSQAISEIYARPTALQDYTFQNRLYYTMDFEQDGNLKTTHFSLAYRINDRLSVGLGYNYVHGDLTKNISENWIFDDITITDDKYLEFRGHYFNGGIWWRLNDKLTLAAVLRTPHTKKGNSESLNRNVTPIVDIRNDAFSESRYKQPLVVGLGVDYQINPKLRVASDLSFFNWSQYSATYFEEEKERNFRNILKIGAGLEYMSFWRIFKTKADIPLRLGLLYDPQPMREPGSAYYYFSFGTGMHWKYLLIDLGVLIGKESGSDDSLNAREISLSISFRI